MTDNERRVRAAELMGWDLDEDSQRGTRIWQEPNGGLIGSEVFRDGEWKLECSPVPPDYPHDMNAAMELVRGARADELTFELYQGAHHGGQWDAAFFGGDGVAVGCGRDELPARAITDAFIEAMRDQISE